MQDILEKDNISSDELIKLLELREDKEVDFVLVDVREPIEYKRGRIRGIDMLKPSSSFYDWGDEFIEEVSGKSVIFTCRTGARSRNIQSVFRANGHTKVINHTGGIFSYRGEIERD